MHPVHAIIEILNALGGLWWEKFEGEDGLACFVGFRQFVLDVHLEVIWRGQGRKDQMLGETKNVKFMTWCDV